LSTKESRINGDAQTGRGASASIETTDAIIAGPSTVTAGLVLKYEADRKREETLKIHLVADIQPVLHDDDGEVEDPETVSGVDVGIPIIESDSDSDAPDDTIPLDDPSRFSYFATDRGLQSVKHIICRMRQKLLFSARAARVSWDCPLGEATGISLRKNAVLRDPRIAGGEAIGKIISYELSGNGDSGEFVAHVTMACAVGNNTAIELSPGSDDVYEDDCFEADCFEHIDQVISALPADDVGFTPPSVSSAGELLFPLDKGQVLVREQIINSVEEQKAAIDDTTPTALDLSNSQGQNMVAAIEAMTQKYFEELQNAIKSKVQKYELELKPVTGGPFTREYIVAPTILSIPKQIDLSAT
jgi:hypothetical protein